MMVTVENKRFDEGHFALSFEFKMAVFTFFSLLKAFFAGKIKPTQVGFEPETLRLEFWSTTTESSSRKNRVFNSAYNLT